MGLWPAAASRNALLTVERLTKVKRCYEIFRLNHGALIASFLGETEIAAHSFYSGPRSGQPTRSSNVDALFPLLRPGRAHGTKRIAAYEDFLETSQATDWPIAKSREPCG